MDSALFAADGRTAGADEEVRVRAGAGLAHVIGVEPFPAPARVRDAAGLITVPPGPRVPRSAAMPPSAPCYLGMTWQVMEALIGGAPGLKASASAPRQPPAPGTMASV